MQKPSKPFKEQMGKVLAVVTSSSMKPAQWNHALPVVGALAVATAAVVAVATVVMAVAVVPATELQNE